MYTTPEKKYETPKKKRPPSASRRPSPGQSPKRIEPKKIYLIRHGQSLGQVADPEARENDPSLTDCGLTEEGKKQAENIKQLLGEEAYNEIELVLTSPLTRAVHTSLLAFPDKPIICQYDLREIGRCVRCLRVESFCEF
jgi:hypothetical protein